MNTILQNPLGEFKSNPISDSEQEHIDTITREINQKKKNSIKKGKELRLHLLADLFNLKSFEIDILLIALAPEFDLRYEKLYSYLQNDVTKKLPQVDLAMHLLFTSIEERIKGREYFSPEAPLIKNRIIHLLNNDQGGTSSLVSNFMKVDERIVNFLTGSNEVDPGIRNFSKMIEPKSYNKDIISGEQAKNRLTELLTLHSQLDDPLILYFHGAYGAGKKTTSEVFCRELGIPLLIVDSHVLNSEKSVETLTLIIREAVLQNAYLYFEGFDSIFKDEEPVIPFNILFNKLDNFHGWIFLSGEDSWKQRTILKNHRFIDYTFSLPDFALRKQLWGVLLDCDQHISMNDDVDCETLANKFNFSGGQIKDAINTASNIAMIKNPVECTISLSDFYQGCKAQSNQNLETLAKKIESFHSWDDLVLPEDNTDQLKEVSGNVKYKGTVYYDWGFDRKLSLGNGLNILFSGPSGTGKTMAAGIISGEVGLDLYKIDLSSIVSKYIGETEKNLKKIFKEAETSNAILFFDEADALFGKRSEVKDSHDRYANIETNYLLQKMEEHNGIVILATNFKKNMDDAFLRRLHFNIEFPFPDVKQREQIWKQIFPEETPIENGVDYKFLASFKITGGNIRNIALNAAFLAAGDSHIIAMEHIIRAIKREFQKMGKLCTQGEFGKYHALVK
ncbi:MAG: ATP-binding protein [Methanosarcinales archaeon]|nr:ATP-binding protein [Methanosarcinales archaeon]